MRISIVKEMLRTVTSPPHAVRHIVYDSAARQSCKAARYVGHFGRKSLSEGHETSTGDQIALACNRLAHTGSGVCFWNEGARRVVIFCSGALPGETILAVVTKVRASNWQCFLRFDCCSGTRCPVQGSEASVAWNACFCRNCCVVWEVHNNRSAF